MNIAVDFVNNHLLREIQAICSPENIILPRDDAYHRIFNTTYDLSQSPAALVKPENAEQLSQILKYAANHRAGIHGISTGCNWGYGSLNPPHRDQIVLSLELFKDLEIDPDLGIMTMGAGTTQGQLFAALHKEKFPWSMSVSGSSPISSIVGNTLTGGFGNGLHIVRMDHALGMKGVLWDGMLVDTTQPRHNRYAPGPDPLGIFRSSGTGIVTHMSFEMPPLPECLHLHFFSVDSPILLPALLTALRTLRLEGTAHAGWSLFSGNRMVAESLRSDMLDLPTPLPVDYAPAVLTELGISIWRGRWNGILTLHTSDQDIARTMSNRVYEFLQHCVNRYRHVELSRSDLFTLRDNLDHPVAGIDDHLMRSRLLTFSGIVRYGSMPLVYWKMPSEIISTMNPDRDGVGLIWLAVSVPNDPEKIANAIAIAEEIMPQHGLDPLYVMDSVRRTECYMMISLVFDRNNRIQHDSTILCYRRLTSALESIGACIFRVPVGFESYIRYSQGVQELRERLRFMI